MPKFLSTDLPKLKDEEDDRSIKKSILDLLDKINTVSDAQYPVGYVYTQYSGQTAPASLFGGTWTDITATSLPTQVYDSGSNANGYWIRYTDGTMECWGQDSTLLTTGTGLAGIFYASSPVTFTFPAPVPFLSAPEVSPSAYGQVNIFSWGAVNVTTTTTIQIYIVSPLITGQAKTQYRAIGKWSSAPVYPVTLWKRTGGSLNQATGTSQVTGIYDSGTVSNGSWIRFTDGTMMCWGVTGSIVASSSSTAPTIFFGTAYITFPVQFSTAPKVVSNALTNSINLVWGGWSSAPTISGFDCYRMSTSVNDTGTMQWQAIGKWK